LLPPPLIVPFSFGCLLLPLASLFHAVHLPLHVVLEPISALSLINSRDIVFIFRFRKCCFDEVLSKFTLIVIIKIINDSNEVDKLSIFTHESETLVLRILVS
jgi:hypothetical protein